MAVFVQKQKKNMRRAGVDYFISNYSKKSKKKNK